MTASVFDVAKYILEKYGSTSTMKLQKLVYYCQAWSLVWDEEPVFHESIEAWANGPVVPELYNAHKGKFKISASDIDGDPGEISENLIETINIVLDHYGKYNPQQLSDLTHQEQPWIDARGNTPALERGNNEISLASMAEYYSSIPITN